MGSMSTTTAISKEAYEERGDEALRQMIPDDSAGFAWPHGGHSYYFLPTI